MITPTVPGSALAPPMKVTLPRGEYTPRQLGPRIRTPAARAASTSCRSSARPAATSPKPLDMTCAKRTFPAAVAISAGTCGAPTAT